ncbi:hypothetical protein SO802_022114 [Lithocarpus litseifolius]|uniref:CCHC-type domain-containing protein n=1 Tax=Lithocarpus litseifolius TaxID=425828 RepID=A0AAW2CIV1_9ROSI
MVYLQLHLLREKPSSGGQNPLRSLTEEGQLGIIGNRSTAIPKVMIFIKRGKPSRSKPTIKYEKPSKESRKCFNCGKKGHFSKECRSKTKSLISTLISDQTSKDEIFRLLELTHIESESTSSSSDHEIHQLNQLSSSSEPFRDSTSFSSPGIDLACRDSFCRNKTINVLSKQVNKQDELLLGLIDKRKQQ